METMRFPHPFDLANNTYIQLLIVFSNTTNKHVHLFVCSCCFTCIVLTANESSNECVQPKMFRGKTSDPHRSLATTSCISDTLQVSCTHGQSQDLSFNDLNNSLIIIYDTVPGFFTTWLILRLADVLKFYTQQYTAAFSIYNNQHERVSF